ncbi:MAG: beta-lactamase family protein [Acidobacteriota bacterium]|nr:beta-lactamase family protein [Acidobacteriota bacterium]
MKILFAKILPIVFSIFFFIVSSSAQGVAPKGSIANLKGKLQAQLNELHAAGKFPGATVGVCLADGTCFGLATGFSDRDAKTPMKPSDLMLSGSVGKTYAAAVAMQLVKAGKIDLNAKIEKYLGKETWFPRLPNAKDITVRQLMNHTSGLVRYEFKEQFTRDLTANVDKTWKPEELVAYILDTKAPFEAGKGWEYSDTNYIVLGMIIERVTGKKFYDLVETRILKPLSLKNTVPSNSRQIRGLVQGYAGERNPFGGKDAVLENGKFIINPQFEWTGGGFASTTEDLARWAKAMYEGKAFDASMLLVMLEGVAAPMLGKETKYGLGVIIRQTQAGTAYGHSGFFPGYLTEMMYFPEQKIALAVQFNTSAPRSTGKPPARFLVELAETISGKEPAQTTAAEKKTTLEKKQFIRNAGRIFPKRKITF